MKTITEDKFWETYKPVINHIERKAQDPTIANDDICSFNGCMYETYGEQDIYVRKINFLTPYRVWTILDLFGVLIIAAGYYTADAYGYLITAEHRTQEDIRTIPDKDEIERIDTEELGMYKDALKAVDITLRLNQERRNFLTPILK